MNKLEIVTHVTQTEHISPHRKVVMPWDCINKMTIVITKPMIKSIIERITQIYMEKELNGKSESI